MKTVRNIFNNYMASRAAQRTAYKFLIKYPTPVNFNYFYNFGSLAGLFLVIQILSGFFLTFFYTPHVDHAFDSVEHIMRNVNYGWFIRYMHSNGASFFFLTVYLHIMRGLYYGSYKRSRKLVWYSGIIIYILMMATAFLGYVLPWGQMSFWAATVITNFLTVIPYVGKDLLYWVWGGSSIQNATLGRIFSLHFILPFVIVVIVMLHILIKKSTGGSGNPLGLNAKTVHKISFYPYFIVKDIFGIILILILFIYVLCYFPDYLGHSDNYIRANPQVTPSHIVPEWYFLPFYGILRSISSKTYGIIIMFVSLFSFFLLPFLDTMAIRNPVRQSIMRHIIFVFLMLGYLGSMPATDTTVYMGLLLSHYLLYLFYFSLPYHSMKERIREEKCRKHVEAFFRIVKEDERILKEIEEEERKKDKINTDNNLK